MKGEGSPLFANERAKMNIKAIFSFPLESQVEFLKRMKRRHSPSEGMVMKGPFFSLGAKERIKSVFIFEFDEEGYRGALENILAQYDDLHEVPGLEFTLMVSKEGLEEK